VFLPIVKVGGFGPSGLTNEICYQQEGRWRHLATVPHVESCNFGCAVLHNQLYIVGGCFNQGLQVHVFGDLVKRLSKAKWMLYF
jgi:kelch-like protein 26